MKEHIIENYFKNLLNQEGSRMNESDFSKEYILKKETGILNVKRFIISTDVELSMMNCKDYIEHDFDNVVEAPEILEIGYCYQGLTEVHFPHSNSTMYIKKGDFFIYKMRNDIPEINFRHENSKTLSISFGNQFIKDAANQSFLENSDIEWKSYIEEILPAAEVLKIFSGCSHSMMIADEIEKIDTSTWVGFLALKSKVLELIASVIMGYHTYKSEENKIVQIVEGVVAGDLGSCHKLDELAKYCNCSIYKLQNAFKLEKNTTVYSYIKHFKINNAKYLLESTDKSIIEIAGEVGYENASKFSKAFSDVIGMSPRDYRKNANKVLKNIEN